jgi:hypothetical protein
MMTGCGPVVWQITDDDDRLWTCRLTDYWWMNTSSLHTRVYGTDRKKCIIRIPPDSKWLISTTRNMRVVSSKMRADKWVRIISLPLSFLLFYSYCPWLLLRTFKCIERLTSSRFRSNKIEQNAQSKVNNPIISRISMETVRLRTCLRHCATSWKIAGLDWNVLLTWFLLLHYDPGVDSNSNKNEYQGSFLVEGRVKTADI